MQPDEYVPFAISPKPSRRSWSRARVLVVGLLGVAALSAVVAVVVSASPLSGSSSSSSASSTRQQSSAWSAEEPDQEPTWLEESEEEPEEEPDQEPSWLEESEQEEGREQLEQPEQQPEEEPEQQPEEVEEPADEPEVESEERLEQPEELEEQRPDDASEVPKLSMGFMSGDLAAALQGRSNGPVLLRSVRRGDVDAQAELKSRLTADFSKRFIDFVNSRGETDKDGKPLHFTHAVILGFPPEPVPSSGHVSNDFMRQTGGLRLTEKRPITFARADPQFTPILADTLIFRQDSPTSASHTLQYSEQFTSSQTVSVTAGVSTEVSTEVSVSVPEIAGARLSTKMSASLSTTASNTQSSSRTWSSQVGITIPANSVTNGTCFLTQGTLSVPFSGELTVADDSNIGWVFYDDRVHKGDTGWFWFWQDSQTGRGLRNAMRFAGSSMSLDFPVSGVYTGVAATGVDCTVHSCKYEPGLSTCTKSNL